MSNSKKSNYDVDTLAEHFSKSIDPESQKIPLIYLRNHPTKESSEKDLHLVVETQMVEKENLRQTITSLMEDQSVQDFLFYP